MIHSPFFNNHRRLHRRCSSRSSSATVISLPSLRIGKAFILRPIRHRPVENRIAADATRQQMRVREREKGGRRMNEGRAERRGTTWWHTVEGFAVAHPGITYLGRRPYSRRARAGLHNGHGGRSLPRRFTIMRREGSHSWASHLSATKGYRGSRWITILSSLWPPRGMVLCAVVWTHCGFIVGLESGSVKGEIGGKKSQSWIIGQFYNLKRNLVDLVFWRI